ncbi:MAG: TRAP transporter large permease subunit, partial [Rhodospirillales bacterium]|nr:TRAP transporter large permease subunit [Rhodospirillales bacterium]
TSFILGIVMTVTAAYIFLAIELAPALVQGGLDPLAVHMFIFYCSMVSYITPPVALGAYAAAAIAGANPMRTGLEAMRLGSIIYFIPFFFVLNTAFILRAPVADIVLLTVSAALGIVMIAGALQGYLIGVGNLMTHATAGWVVRALILIGGIFLATPSGGPITLTDFEMMLIALSLSGPGIVLARWLNFRAARAAGTA